MGLYRRKTRKKRRGKERFGAGPREADWSDCDVAD